MFVGFIISGISFILLGPDTLIEKYFFEPRIFTIILMLSTIGCGLACCNIPALPEFLHLVTLKKGNEYNSDIIPDVSSGLYNSAYSLGECLGPILGGIFT